MCMLYEISWAIICYVHFAFLFTLTPVVRVGVCRAAVRGGDDRAAGIPRSEGGAGPQSTTVHDRDQQVRGERLRL